MGGYPTTDGHLVRRGHLFRSGAPTSLTDSDIAYLSQFRFRTVVDLRSNEERELFPNRWVKADADIDYRYLDYSIMDMMSRMKGRDEATRPGMDQLYRGLPKQIVPQLKLYFAALLNERTPVVVNCSAGQDRTGFTAALVLSVLGVARELVIEDYLLSTDFRRPDREMGDVDLEAASATNSFAKVMLAYSKQGSDKRPNPLMTEDGVPFIVFALEQIDADYGSVEAYLRQEIGLPATDITRLRALYLVDQAA
jgi:protein-tyrosine phosphatase